MARWGRGAVFSSDNHVLRQFRCGEGVEVDTSAPFCGRGTLQVKDAVTGKMVPLSVLESEQDKAARKIRNMNRTDAQTGALFAQANPQAPCTDSRHCHFPDEAHLLRQSLSTPDALFSSHALSPTTAAPRRTHICQKGEGGKPRRRHPPRGGCTRGGGRRQRVEVQGGACQQETHRQVGGACVRPDPTQALHLLACASKSHAAEITPCACDFSPSA